MHWWKKPEVMGIPKKWLQILFKDFLDILNCARQYFICWNIRIKFYACLAIFFSPGYNVPRWEILLMRCNLCKEAIYIHIFLCCSWSYSQFLITAVFAKKGNIFITFPSFENSHYFSSNAVYASGQIAMQCRIVMTKYADPQFSIVFANSASNSKFKQKSAWEASINCL